MPKTIIVSNRLPLSIENKEGQIIYKPSAGGLATGLSSIYKEQDNIWIGWPGIHIASPVDQQRIYRDLRKENMHPIFLAQKDIEDYYEGFCNKTIWPNFHYFTHYGIYKSWMWEAYQRVNQLFCEEVLSFAKDGDTIWIHDYQLMLLPNLLRKHLPNAKIGYFNHIPFPSYEIFRMLPCREELLTGLLGADLIGYHTYDDMRHFLSAVTRIIGLNHTMGELRQEERVITVDAFPLGIDYQKYAHAANSTATLEKIDAYKTFIKNGRLILSIDRLDYSKGIPNRLRGFSLFLNRHPEYIGKVTLVMVVVPSRVNVKEYKELKEYLDKLVGEINGKYGTMDWSPVLYFYRSLSFVELSALYRMSSIALITPLRDGMNLVCKEYIASRLDHTGVLILSEMAGSAKELTDAMLINPNSIPQIVNAIKTALEMPVKEQVKNMKKMQTHLKRYDVNHWVKGFMKQLNYTKELQAKQTIKQLNSKQTKEIQAAFQAAKQPIIFLDYDGTLMPFSQNPDEVFPDKTLIDLLLQLCEVTKVVIISGRDKKSLAQWFKNLPVDIIAEHGVWFKKQGESWKKASNLEQGWKKDIRPILELYVDRTPGSFIEEKDYSLVWHYRKADIEFGALRARELTSNLQYFTKNMKIQVMEGDKIIEIKNASINKGKAAARWLKLAPWDFIFAIGDDRTDEDTFQVMPPTAYTVKVGFKTTHAQYQVKSTKDVRELLELFVAVGALQGVES